MPKRKRAAPSKAAPRTTTRRRPAARRPSPSGPPNTPPVARPAQRSSDSLVIAGVGASAGGLEAFSQLLNALSPNAGLAVIFVQHLAPHYDSALVTLLSAQTSMPVLQAAEGMPIEPNHVYVIPPNVQMVLEAETLHLRPRPDDRTQYTPVDAFLTSLAESAGTRAVGVVLSGTASDGAQGIREIKAAGGITMAQSPESARYDGMPRAAMTTGMVDLVLTPANIAAKLNQLATHAYAHAAEPSDIAIADGQLQRVFELLRPVSGVDFRHYKLPTIKRRLFRRMALHRLTEPAQYIRLLESNPAEVRALYQDLLIHVTRFFREPDSFGALATHVYPPLLEERGPDHPIRVWVSGCATGEEAYSVAISLIEFLQREQSDIRVQIFATDVSETAIEYARAGVYPKSIEADVSPERLRRFFTRHDAGYRVTKMVRDLCVFARQDLTKDPPFSRLDLVLCRNVLIYMDAVLQKKLLSMFHYALNPNGYLMLGQAETVGAQVTLFTLVEKKYRIHRKKPSASSAGISFPVDYSVPGLPRRKPVADAAGTEKALQSEVNRVIMDRYAPAGVVVDHDLQIVQFRGQTGAFLEPAPGEASLNLLKMAREGLLYGLRTALHAARKSKNVVRKDGLQVRDGNQWKAVSLEVIPLASSGRSHYLVLFDDFSRTGHPLREAAPAKTRTTRALPRREQAAQVDLLQRELAASREYLQSIIQELEAANEELQSANEEILSSNEELQSTNEELDTAKEELQSTNEELNTVNEELHGRNEELSRVNSDLVNLVGSVQIAIVIVSADLRIRRFTPMAEKVLNLISSDLDRSIGHINPNIECPNLEQLIADCIDSVTPIEKEVQDRQGRWYSLRIRPYKNVDNRIDGAVIALFDIDVPKRSEESVRAAVELAHGVLEAAGRPMALMQQDLRIRAANEAFARAFDRSADDIAGQAFQDVARGLRTVDPLRAVAATADLDGASLLSLPLDGASGARTGLDLTVRALPSYDSPAQRLLLLTLVGEASHP